MCPAVRRLGDQEVLAIGLGAMPMSLEGRPHESQSIRTMHAALDAGCGLIDTADAYCLDESEIGHNERLVARALQGRGDGVLVATKGGLTRRGADWPHDASPAHLRSACEASLRALGRDCIDLYQLHRPDPAVPFADSLAVLRDLQAEGKVRWIGLSNVSVGQIEEALAMVEVVSVQNELSLGYTGPVLRGEVAACTERGIAFLAWSPLGGIGKAGDAAANAAVAAAAARHGVSAQRVALAWELSLGPTVLPIPGARRPETILDSLAAASLELEPAELRAISAAAGLEA